jgi:translation initiation factor IF-3
VGILSIEDALKKAQDVELDLVEVAPSADPPVCRIMDYSKYKYEQSKRAKEAKKKQKIIEVKEIKFKPKIEEHDYQVKLGHAIKFLQKNERVKVSLRYRGREAAHPEIGKQLLDRFIADTSEYGELAKEPNQLGKTIILFIDPKIK